jgi:hypothetical protein
MNLQGVKDVLFRHGEKIVLGAVALFVVMNVVGHFSGQGPEDAAEGVTVDVPPSEEVSKAIEPAFVRASRPYVSDIEISTPRRTPFWPPMTVPLADVRLQMEKKEEAERGAGAPVVGQPRQVTLTPAEVAAYAPDPGRGFTEDPCRVQVSVGGEDRDTLVFKAVSPGRWVAYEALLANENRCRVLVKVDPKDLVLVDEVVAPEIKSLKEEELGAVVLRFIQPPKPEEDPDPRSRRIVTRHLPTEYRIYRRSEFDEKRILIERIASGVRSEPARRRGPSERMGPPPGEGYPGGYPGAGRPPRRGGMSAEARAEGGMAAPVPAPGPGAAVRREGPPQPAEEAPPRRTAPRREAPAEGETEEKFKPESENEYVFVDRSVEAEVTYTYWLEAVVDQEAAPEAAPETAQEIQPVELPPREVKTKQKFTFKYVGGTYDEAQIMVFIGPTEEPLAQQTFTVPIGGYIGALPPKPGAVAEPAEGEAEGPPPEAPEGAVAKAGGEETQFVTRYVLVDVIPNAFRVVPYVSTVSERNEEGRLVPRRVTVLREELARQVIIRDRKQRLLRLWYERAPRPPKKETEPTRGRRRPPSRRYRR